MKKSGSSGCTRCSPSLTPGHHAKGMDSADVVTSAFREMSNLRTRLCEH